MTPEKLKLRGFITYRDEVEIDFRKFQEDKIFMICGPTGSGKTSLFDAICFALYGQVSTDVRGSDESLRCDFLTPSDPETYVDFTFSQGGHEYRVVRYPAQYRQRRTGSITKESSKAELYKDGIYVDLGKVSEVTEEIIGILGLTRDQFTKIVMLPQGEFARFLSSPSKEKEAILRKIFGTGQYEAFGQAVKAKKDEADKELSALRLGGDSILKNLDPETREAVQSLLTAQGTGEVGSYHKIGALLQGEGESARKREEELQRQTEANQKNLEQKHQYWTLAVELNRELEELAQVEAEMQEQSKRETLEEEKRKEISLAREAFALKPLEEAWQRSRDKVQQLQKQMLEEESKGALLKKEVLKWEAAEELLPDRRMQLDQLREQGIHLKEELKTFGEMERRSQEQQEKQLQLQKLETLLVQKTQERSRREESLQELDDIEEKALLLQKEQQQTERQIHEVQLWENSLQALENLFRRQEALAKSLGEERNRLQRAGKEEQNLRSIVTKQEEQRKEQGLYPYVEQLKEGEPCPLCGSPHHPHPLEIGSLQQEGSHLEDQRQKWMEAMGEAAAAADLISHKEKELLMLEEELKRLQQEMQTAPTSSREIQETQKALAEKKLGWSQKQKDLERKEQELQEQRQRRKALEKQKQNLEKEIKDLELEQNTAIQQKKNLELRQKEDRQKVSFFASLEEGEKKLLQLRENYTRLDKEIQQITKEAADNRTSLAQSQTKLESLLGSHQEEEKRQFAEKEEFETRRKEKFSREEEYTKIKENMQHLLEQEKDNQTFFRELEGKRQHFRLLAAKLEGKTRQDVDKIQEEIQELRLRQKEDQEQRDALQLRYSKLKEWTKQMKSFAAAAEGILKRRQTAAELYALCRGDNPRSLSFETYVLLWYFDDVLDYANERLYRISNGQYELSRREENQKERGQNKGLEIAVLDTNTGKERSSSTLSGGESFLVSLALALGLSDAMAGAAGGIQVGALFIDEGFGTLDQDKLQSAVDCLAQLTSANRLIGIISHVEELKESIPGKIIVTYHRDRGSRVTCEGITGN